MGGRRPGGTTTMDSTTSNLIFRLLLSLPAETIDGLANTGQTKSPKNRVEKICLQRYPYRGLQNLSFSVSGFGSRNPTPKPGYEP